VHRNRSTKAGKTKVKVSKKPSTANTYKYNAIGGKAETPSQTIQKNSYKKGKPKTIKMKGKSLR
jgi:hypothetical protein